jgi:hypothetical protein
VGTDRKAFLARWLVLADRLRILVLFFNLSRCAFAALELPEQFTPGLGAFSITVDHR